MKLKMIKIFDQSDSNFNSLFKKKCVGFHIVRIVFGVLSQPTIWHEYLEQF